MSDKCECYKSFEPGAVIPIKDIKGLICAQCDKPIELPKQPDRLAELEKKIDFIMENARIPRGERSTWAQLGGYFKSTLKELYEKEKGGESKK